MENKFLCKFNSEGKRIETRLSCEYTEGKKADMIGDGYIEIGEEEWKLYCEDGGNKYIRIDGKPTLAPPHVPTKAEKLATLEAQYEADKEELKGYLMDAILTDDNATVAEIKQEMAEREAQYQTDREQIEREG